MICAICTISEKGCCTLFYGGLASLRAFILLEIHHRAMLPHYLLFFRIAASPCWPWPGFVHFSAKGRSYSMMLLTRPSCQQMTCRSEVMFSW